MSNPNVTVCGAYRLDPSPELFAQAMRWKYPEEHFSARERKAAVNHVWDEIMGVVLLDVRIENCDERFQVDHFGQSGSDQAAYLEVFLTHDGTATAPEPVKRANGQTVRVAFYLHFFDERKPLNTTYGPVAVPPVQRMLSRLFELAPYEPVI